MNAQIIFAEDLEQQQNGISNRLSVINPVLAARVPFLPTTYSFSLVIIVSGYDFSKKGTIKITLESPEGEELFNTNEQQVPGMSDTDNLNLNLDLKNIILRSDGDYVAKLEYNGNIVATQKLRVNEVPHN